MNRKLSFFEIQENQNNREATTQVEKMKRTLGANEQVEF
jgi:hypothetical protein